MSITKSIDMIRHARSGILKTVEEMDLATLNQVPANFNNNVIWNLAHLIATQESVCYAQCGLPTKMPAEMIARYANGTKPEAPVSQEELDFIKSWALSSLDQLAEDISDRKFDNYTTLSFSPAATFNTIEEILIFLGLHEGMHYGSVQSLKHVLPKAA